MTCGCSADRRAAADVMASRHRLSASPTPAAVAIGGLLSYLFFAPEFAAALIELGRSHAQHWLATHTGPDGPWQLDSADPIH